MAERDSVKPAHGGAGYKRKGQKYKSLLVWQVLLKRTDEEHPLSVDDIQDHLRMYGMETERRSIYRDISNNWSDHNLTPTLEVDARHSYPNTWP